MSKAINLIFPHQLFDKSPLLSNGNEVYLIEEYLYFNHFQFHKQKIAFHRASMKYYEQFLKNKGITVHYIDSFKEIADIRNFGEELIRSGATKIHAIEPTDKRLEKRLRETALDKELILYNDPQFLNSKEELSSFFRKDKKSFFQTTFYKQQRKKHNILLDNEGKPTGGKWTYDAENRKKYPKNKTPPPVLFPSPNDFWIEANKYTNEYFSNNPGSIGEDQYYPTTHDEASKWLDQFLVYRFYNFGAYEDAIVKKQIILNHSVLSPLLNSGLLKPDEVLERSIQFAEQENIPINSLEGFIRQIIGWREFIRGMYIVKGNYSRTKNYWGFTRKIPLSFYDGTSGIEPIDVAIKKVLQTGYCHHIERLMILGNFMLLCEFDPDEVYAWFMELFIDAYDWVMVPNVYGMSQFADGGTFATKPYISGSNYIKKMSDFENGEWEKVWDGLFWSFLNKHQDFFKSNPRLSMLVHSFNRMTDEKKQEHTKNAERFIQTLV